MALARGLDPGVAVITVLSPPGDGRVLLISPADKAGFLAALRRRSPRLTP
jgi:hypothetical protein